MFLRPTAPSYGTKHLRSVRSVSAKEVGYQTSSADGSCELSGAAPRCGMACFAGLSSHRRPCTRCGHVALPIVQICASPKGVACLLLRGPPLQAAPIGLGQSTTFTVSLKGITETQAARHSAHDHPLSRAEPNNTIPLRRLHCASPTNNPKHRKKLAPKK
jgi:hypothetical protein